MKSKRSSENRGLRLFQLAGQADGLLNSVDPYLPCQPDAPPPPWLCRTVIRLFEEVIAAIPDPEYFRHMSPKGLLKKKEWTLFELRTALACAFAAAHQFADVGVQPMGFRASRDSP